jgi:hypothetical protein
VYPYCNNINGIEITIIKVMTLTHVTIIGIYRSPKVPVGQMCAALNDVLTLRESSSQFSVFIGDFNVNWLNETDRMPI